MVDNKMRHEIAKGVLTAALREQEQRQIDSGQLLDGFEGLEALAWQDAVAIDAPSKTINRNGKLPDQKVEDDVKLHRRSRKVEDKPQRKVPNRSRPLPG